MIVMKASRRVIPGAAAGAAAIGLIATLAGCSPGSSGPDDGKVHAIASFYPLQYITQRVGGSHVDVTSLTKPGVEPHDLELSPRQTGSLIDADLVVYLKGLQPAVDEAVRQTHPEHVVQASRYAPLEKHGTEVNGVDGHTEPAPGDHSEEAAGDPHIWLDPVRLAKVVDGVRKELSATDPEHAAAYRANAGKLDKDLGALDKQYRDGLSGLKNRTFITSHAAFGYLAERYRLDEVSINGVDPESEPSPAHLAGLQRTARREHVTTIFFEALVSPKTARTLADDLHLKTAVLDPIEGVKDPSRNDYFSIMRQNLTNLRTALESS
jgi:zinc transport system substrate-binding protein